MNKRFYTTNEAGPLLGVKPQTITRYIELGQVKAEKIGRDYVISAEELDRFKNIPRKVGRPVKA